MNEIKKFVVGQTYTTRFICDHESILSMTVADRTEKTITTTEGKKYRINASLTNHFGVEMVKYASYSMSPIFRAA